MGLVKKNKMMGASEGDLIMLMKLSKLIHDKGMICTKKVLV